jgi:Arc/MetJ-type ribon-helix-helix transcriptional regulator
MSDTNRDEYTSIKLPKGFVEMIDEILDVKRLGFTSRAEVVKTAVREYHGKIMKKN